MKEMNDVKINGDVAFYEDGHVYVNVKNPKIKYISVTTLIADYYEKFDSDFWSGYKALEQLMGSEFFSSGVKTYLLKNKKIDLNLANFVNLEEYTKVKEGIAASYKEKGTVSAAHGTKIHKPQMLIGADLTENQIVELFSKQLL